MTPNSGTDVLIDVELLDTAEYREVSQKLDTRNIF